MCALATNSRTRIWNLFINFYSVRVRSIYVKIICQKFIYVKTKNNNNMFKIIPRTRHVTNKFRSFSKLNNSPTRTSWPFKKLGVGTAISVLIGYDGYTNDFEYVKAGGRFCRSAKITIQLLNDYFWALRGLDENDPRYERILREVNIRSANRIVDGCLKNGGLYIKVGQGVSAINHILPKEFTETLKQLEDKCLPRKSDEVTKIFLQDFGKTPDEMFNNFNYTPIAAASLAQVFTCETKSGAKLAVKVQYIDLQRRFKSDMGTILFLSNVVGQIFESYKFGWIIEELKDQLFQELDFINEGKNLERCENDLRKLDYVYLPKIYWQYTTKRILTAEFIDGYKISDVQALRKNNFNLADVNEKVFKIFAEQIFNTGFLHADPHPGNVFVRRNPKTNKCQIVLLDHGLYQTIPYDIRQHLCNFWKSIVLRDIRAMDYYSNQLNVKDSKRFAEILMQRPFDLGNSKYTWSTKLTDEELNYITQIAKENFGYVMNTLKEMPRHMLFVVRNLNTVRAIAREHGDPVDRPKIMARYALKCIEKNKSGFFAYINYFREVVYFEYKLWVLITRFWMLTTYLKFLTKIGRSPDTSAILYGDVDA